jgi:hypothetical protein
MRRAIAPALIVALLASCGRAPQLEPRLIQPDEPVGKDFWLAAPYVLVVKILRAGLEGQKRSIFRGGEPTLQLVRFEADVENVIKGNLANKRISFYFFVETDHHGEAYFLSPGRRYIVSLRREGGVLRSWADATQLRIWVHSGAHAQRDLPLTLGAETSIAYIMLTPGAGCSLREFENTLSWSYGKPEYVQQRLERLQLSSDRELRESACLASAAWFAYRPQCLLAVAGSPDEGNRQQASGFLETDDVNLAGLLQSNPPALFPEGDYMAQMLGIYSQDLRPEVRKRAREILQRFRPQARP